MNLSVRLLIVLLFSLNVRAQEKPIDNALLWKVTGKGMQAPSFLFGTIHLQDKRVFNFNDSLYSFIKAADGFAMEIHPDSVVSALMQKADETAMDKLMLRQQLNKDEFSQLSRKLKKELGIDANKLTIKDAYLLKDHLSKPEPRADDMPTFVDAYLFGVARNQGKEIVGLEKATDQMNMLDDIKGDFDVKELIKGMKKEKNLTERLVQLYIREDLQAIHNLMSYLPQETEDKLLNLRNHLMVLKMDSLIQSKSFVVAVGTAHLPGKKGMIELLRQKGYSVEPVFTTTRTHANNYAIKAAQKTAWVNVTEPQLGYSVRMPGKPSPMDMLSGSMKMNMYMDLSSMKMYYAAFVVPAQSVTKQNADSILNAMCKNAMSTSNGGALSKKRFVKDKFEGIDFVYKQPAEKMFARMQAIAMGKRVYLVGFGSPRQEDLSTQEANDFFNSFALQDMPENTWETQTFSDHYFTVALPVKAKMVQLPVTDSSVRSVQFNSMDNHRGSYFGLTVVTTNPGYLIPNDSAYFASALERLKDNMVLYNLQQYDTTFNGFAALRITAKLKDELKLNCFMISRGNRVYNLTAITNEEDSATTDIGDFFKSFAFTDYPKLSWQSKQLNDLAITVPMTTSYTRVNFLDNDEDSAKSAREFQWVTYDSASATSFYITRRALSPYLWVKHDSVLLKKYMVDFTDEGETVTGYRFVRNGNSSGIEFDIKKSHSSLAQRMRVILNGHAVYILQADAPKEYWKRNSYQQFLEGFSIEKEIKPDFLYTNSLQQLLADLASTDSATHAKAYNAIDEMIFDSTDVAALLRAVTVDYALDTMHYLLTSDRLLQAVAKIKNSGLVNTIATYYNQLKPGQDKFRYSMLTAIASQHTEQSYAAVEKLLRQGLPTQGDPGEFVRSLGNEPLLVKKLYPYLISLSGDSLLGTPLFYLHEDMLDSNLVSIDVFRPYQHLILSSAANELVKINADKSNVYYSFGVHSLLRTLGKLNTDSTKQMLRKFTHVRQVNIKDVSALLLLKLQQPVDAAVLEAIAADKNFRTGLYDELKEVKQEKLFPSKYFNQKSFAEGYIYTSLDDDDGPTKLQFIGERTVMFKGQKRKFYLFKAMFDYDREQSSYLCIGGSFSLDGKKVLAEEDASGVYWEEQFSQGSIDKFLKAYLAEYELSEVEDAIKED